MASLSWLQAWTDLMLSTRLYKAEASRLSKPAAKEGSVQYSCSGSVGTAWGSFDLNMIVTFFTLFYLLFFSCLCCKEHEQQRSLPC